VGRLFKDLSLDPLVLDGIRDMGYREMTAIQEKAIPIVLDGQDLIGSAQTGTGKTAAFLVPMIDKFVRLKGEVTRALILTPTRELALQIDEQLVGLAYHAGVTSACIVGGMSFGEQERFIRENSEVLIATPGRMIDHLRFDHVDFSCVEYLVLDEADRMLDMGFLPDVLKIVGELPKKRQTLMFSATIDANVKRLAKEFLQHPKIIQIGRQVPVASIRQRFIEVSPAAKESLLLKLLRREEMDSVLIFVKTKRGVRKIDRRLQRERISSDALHGDRLQEDRVEALDRFRRGEVNVLVATDVASRGLDITDVSHVINFDMPNNADAYIHRVGRTARAKKEGDSITFVTRWDRNVLREIEKAIQRKVQLERISVQTDRRPRKKRKRRY